MSVFAEDASIWLETAVVAYLNYQDQILLIVNNLQHLRGRPRSTSEPFKVWFRWNFSVRISFQPFATKPIFCRSVRIPFSGPSWRSQPICYSSDRPLPDTPGDIAQLYTVL